MNQKVSLPGEAQAYSNVTVSAIDGVNHGFVPTGFGIPSTAVPGKPSGMSVAAAKMLADGVDAIENDWEGALPSYLVQSAYKDATGQQMAHRDYASYSKFARRIVERLNKPDNSDLMAWMMNEQGWNRLPLRATKRLLLMSPNLWETVGRALGDSNISAKHYVVDNNKETNHRIACAELAFNYPERFVIVVKADVDSWIQMSIREQAEDAVVQLYSLLGVILRNGNFRIYDKSLAPNVHSVNGMSDSYVHQMYVQNINKVSTKRTRFV
jgi:hypothetical protein